MTNFGDKLKQYVNGNLPSCNNPIKAVDDNNFCHKCGKQLQPIKHVSEADQLRARIATLENDAKLNDMAWNDNQAALNKQAEEIRTLKQALTKIRATTVTLGDLQSAWKAWRKCSDIAGEALK